MQDQLALFDALWQAGQKYGIGLYGSFAMNAMRLEKGYRAWGSEFTTERTPLECGCGTLVKPDDRAFTGKTGMLERAQRDDHWSMALLQLEQRVEDPFYLHSIMQENRPVGMVTSGAYGHRTGMVLALAYFSEPPGQGNLTVEILGKPVPASILHRVPYDPENVRMKG
jgi:dimethylglycine dehydrogenase